MSERNGDITSDEEKKKYNLKKNIETCNELKDFYYKSNVTLSANVFENFQETVSGDDKTELFPFFVSPGYTTDARLRFTKKIQRIQKI